MVGVKGKIGAVVLATALGASSLFGVVGCAQSGGGSEMNSAVEVYEKYTSGKHDNFNMAGTIDVKASMQGMTMDVPVTLNMDVNGTNAHGTFGMNALGMDMSAEIYTVQENGKTVTYTLDTSANDVAFVSVESEDGSSEPVETETYWVKSESEGIDPSTAMTDIDKSVFENAEFAKTTDGYTVTISGADAMNSVSNTLAASTGSSAMADSMLGSYASAFDNIKVVYTFDKDCNLTAISIPETKVSVEESGQSYDITISGDIKFSNFGKIADITVPKDVVDNAIDESTTFETAEDGTAVIGDSDGIASSANEAVSEGANKAESAINDVAGSVSNAASSAADTSKDVASK